MKLPIAYWFTSAIVAVAGVGIMAAGYVKMQEYKMGENSATYEVDDFTSIQTQLPKSRLQLIASETAETATVELKCVPPTVRVFEEEGTLWVTDAGWANLHLFSFGWVNDQAGEVIITVPAKEYEDVCLSAGFGKENTVSGVHADTLSIDGGAGDWKLSQTESNLLTINSGAGDFSLDGVQVLQSAWLDIGAGNTKMNNCTYQEFVYSQGAGNLECSGVTVQDTMDVASGAGNCTFDVCKLAGDTTFDGIGNFELNDLFLSGDMDITTGSGNVTIGIIGNAGDYTVDCDNHVGNVTVAGNKGTVWLGSGKHTITINGVGNVDVSFHD